MDKKIYWSDLGNIAFLEGGAGFDNDQEDLIKFLVNKKRNYPICIDNLYQKPENILTLRYLKPKTVVLQTTGVYKSDLDNCFKHFELCEYVPDNVILLFGEDALRTYIKKYKSLNPKLKVFQAYLFGEDDVILNDITDNF